DQAGRAPADRRPHPDHAGCGRLPGPAPGRADRAGPGCGGRGTQQWRAAAARRDDPVRAQGRARCGRRRGPAQRVRGRGAQPPGGRVPGRLTGMPRQPPADLGIPADPPAPPDPGIPVPPPPAEAVAVFRAALPTAERYAQLLAGPGVTRGLLGPREVPRLWSRHLLNSAAIADLVPRPATLIDLGSGAGLPGIVLALLLPDVTVTLVERMQRRSIFLTECVGELGLGNVRVCQATAEELAGKVAADVVTARAVAPLDRLAGLAAGLVRPGGLILAIKGATADEEVARARPVLRRLGIRDVAVVRAGEGKVDRAATVVRLVAGR